MQFEIHRVAKEPGLWETVFAMNKPELIITSRPDDDFLTGGCSSCPQVKFKLTGNDLHQKQVLRGMFDHHFQRVHMREDAKQSDARIVKDATEDN